MVTEPTQLFVNRELSFLEFNQRIVDEATDVEVPLLERLKFVSIVAANLDEFFMIRVAGLKQQLKSGVMETGPEGMLAKEQLARIVPRVARQVEDIERLLLDELLPALEREGLSVRQVSDLDRDARARLAERFEQRMFPMLTPLAVDPGHPFPFLKNRSLNLAVHLLPRGSAEDAIPLLAVVQVPAMLPRFVELEHEDRPVVVRTEDIITEFVGTLFPGMRIVTCVPFRVIRNWDLEVDEDEQEDLIDAVESELQRRWKLDAVRLEIAASASDGMVEDLRAPLKLHPRDVQRNRGPLALADFEQLLTTFGRPDLRDEPYTPVLPRRLREAEDLFAEIARGDVLLHHPYESYEPVVDLVAKAASDPAVLAIKQTLYRTHRDSPIVRSLAEAAGNGKQVTALVELKARFDEQTNIEWARELEEAGVHVFYGVIGLKTHCKITLIVRREATGIRRYVHLGTGNYNEKTATIYSDLSFFSAREDVSEDIAALFNLLTGYSEPPAWQKLVVAPLDLRRTLLEHISRAREVARRGGPARIVLKSNALIDAKVIGELCRASQAGVDVLLLIRGPCALRVGVPGVSDRIVVRTIVDRFLEHSRVFYFALDGREEVFITSTDIMPRNFDRRVEVMLPIEDEALRRRIVDEILALELADDVKAAVVGPDGAFRRVARGSNPQRAQAAFIALARKRATGKKKKRKKEEREGRRRS
jgi:polyphosphate kinase